MYKKYLPIIIFNLIYISGFSIYYLNKENYEFLLYVGVIILFFILLLSTIHKTKLSKFTLIGLSIWGLMHMSGGGLIINNDVLYNLILIPISDTLSIFKYDQLVHAFGFGITTLLSYELLKPHLKTEKFQGAIILISIMAASGFGALNEIVEFIATIITPETNVGGYINTSLDLVFNLIGATIAAIIIKISSSKTSSQDSH